MNSTELTSFMNLQSDKTQMQQTLKRCEQPQPSLLSQIDQDGTTSLSQHNPKDFPSPVRLGTSALVGYPDPDPWVFRAPGALPRSVKICSHRWLGSVGQNPMGQWVLMGIYYLLFCNHIYLNCRYLNYCQTLAQSSVISNSCLKWVGDGWRLKTPLQLTLKRGTGKGGNKIKCPSDSRLKWGRGEMVVTRLKCLPPTCIWSEGGEWAVTWLVKTQNAPPSTRVWSEGGETGGVWRCKAPPTRTWSEGGETGGGWRCKAPPTRTWSEGGELAVMW